MSKDFDAIAKAIESGDNTELDKLMEQENEEVAVVVEEEVLIPEDPIVENANESEETPESKSEEVVPTEAAVPAASPVDETEELKKELQRYKSDAGRVPFIQRRMAELEREVRAYKARESQPTQGGSTPASNVAGVELDEETKAQIEELREVDPTMAKAMERIAKAAIAGSRQNAEAVITSYTQAEQEEADNRFLIEQQTELVRDVPRAYEIFATPQWKQWKETLTPGQRAMAESAYANDVKQAIYAFAAVMNQSQPAAVTPTVETPQVAVSTEASDKVKQARERKVGTSAEIKTGSAKKSVELDEDAYFREAYEKIGKKNHLFSGN